MKSNDGGAIDLASQAIQPGRKVKAAALDPALGEGKPEQANPPFKETDLYPPLKAWLEKNGYEVHGEVAGCDVAARRGEELVLIEIKRAINLELLLQLLRRQEAAEAVYAAVPAPKSSNKRWRELTRLLKRLEAGLILIFTDSPRGRVELAFHPSPQERRPRWAKTRAFLQEMSGRSRDLNLGGSTRKKIMTAYREQALGVAEALSRLGVSSPKTLRAEGCGEKTGSILRNNHYGWFEKVSRGLYCLTESGLRELNAYLMETCENR